MQQSRPSPLDVLRGLLPASTLTNLGITGNGRAFEYLLSTMFASNLNEDKITGRSTTYRTKPSYSILYKEEQMTSMVKVFNPIL